ncbi:hypothetical protein Thermo_00901 [Thermoplasmatales archaeon]|nr:hypothetical protein Thermo_00901 [Thermoplasmatales archaeon]
MIIKRKRIFALLVSLILVSMGGYTLASYVTEPRLPNPAVTSEAFAREITITGINVEKGAPVNFSFPSYSSLSTLFFHNFTLDGSSATYGFSLALYLDYQYFEPGLIAAFFFLVTKVSQSMGFPYLGTFLLQVHTANMSILINGTRIYQDVHIAGNPNYLKETPSELAYNDTINLYGYPFTPQIPFAINKSFDHEMAGMIYGSSYNVTYSLEVAPVIEYGPYYVIGPTQWISRTVQIPFVNQ